MHSKTSLAISLLVMLVLSSLVVYPQRVFSQENTGSVEITVRFPNGERASTYQMVLNVYMDTRTSPYLVLDPLESNPVVLTSLPLAHKYIFEVYVNGMYAGLHSMILDNSRMEKILITIPSTGGMRFNVFYNDGITPIEGAVVSIKSHDGTVWRETSTDSLGQTPRFWMAPTILPDNYFIISTSIGKNHVYDMPFIKLESGARVEIKIVTPWSSRVDELKVSVFKSSSEKVSVDDGEFYVELYDPSEKKVSESPINRKGDAYFTGIPVGDYTLRVFKINHNIPDNVAEWASKSITVASREVTIDIVKDESSTPTDNRAPFVVANAKKVVILTFDDGYMSQFKNAKPVLDKYGFKATFFIVCNWVGVDSSMMSWEDIQLLWKEGHDIESLTMNHKDLSKLSSAELEYEVAQPKQCLYEHNINATVIAFPYHAGWNNATVIGTVAKHYDFARAGRSAVMDLTCDMWRPEFTDQTDCRTYFPNGTLTWVNRYSLRGWSHVTAESGLNNTRIFDRFVEVSNVEVNKGGEIKNIPILIYRSIDGEDEKLIGTSTTLFEAEMKYLYDNGFDVLTMSDLGYDEVRNELYVKEEVERQKRIIDQSHLGSSEETSSTQSPDGSLQEENIHGNIESVKCNCVNFRLDDVQDHFARPAQIALMDLFLSRNQGFTTGIITEAFGNDTEVIRKVRQGVDKGVFELALHGCCNIQYTTLDFDDQKDTLYDGNRKIQKLLGERANIFIPPFNRFDANTIRALQELDIKILSSSFDWDRYQYFVADGKINNYSPDEIYHLPSVVGYKYRNEVTKTWDKTPIWDIEGNVTSSVEKYGYAVITLHPQDFVIIENGKFTRTLDIKEIVDLSNLIDYIMSKGMRIATMAEIVGVREKTSGINDIINSIGAGFSVPTVKEKSEHIVVENIHLDSIPFGVAVNHNTNMKYVSNFESDSISVIDCTTNTVIATVPVGDNPQGVAVNPNTNMIYVINWYSDSLSVIDASTNTVVNSIHIGGTPFGLAVNPNTNMIYASDWYSNSLSVIDGSTNTVIATVPVGDNPQGVAVNPNTNMVYVISSDMDSLYVIDGSTNTVIATVPVGDNPQGVAVNPNTNMVYVSNSDLVHVIDGSTDSIVDSIQIAGNPVALTVNPNSNMVYVSNSESELIFVIDGVSNTIVDTVRVESTPVALAVNPVTDMIYASNSESEFLSVIDIESVPIGMMSTGSANITMSNATIQLSPDVVEAGKTLLITGRNFTENSEFAIILGEDPLTSVISDEDGSMRVALRIPETFDAGSYTLMILDNNNEATMHDLTVKNSRTQSPVENTEADQVFNSILAELERIQQALDLLFQKISVSGNSG